MGGKLDAVTFYEPIAWFSDRLKSEDQCAFSSTLQFFLNAFCQASQKQGQQMDNRKNTRLWKPDMPQVYPAALTDHNGRAS